MVFPFDTSFSLLLSFLKNYLLLTVLQMPPPVPLLPPSSTRFPSYLISAIRTKENVFMLGQYHSSLWTETCLDTSKSQSMHHTLKGSDSQPFRWVEEQGLRAQSLQQRLLKGRTFWRSHLQAKRLDGSNHIDQHMFNLKMLLQYEKKQLMHDYYSLHFHIIK